MAAKFEVTRLSPTSRELDDGLINKEDKFRYTLNSHLIEIKDKKEIDCKTILVDAGFNFKHFLLENEISLLFGKETLKTDFNSQMESLESNFKNCDLDAVSETDPRVEENKIPSLKRFDISKINAILVTSANMMLMIPYLIESEESFQGEIYCTEPVAQFAKESLLSFTEQFDKLNREKWNRKTQDNSGFKGSYSRQALEKTLSKIKSVRYLEIINLGSGVTIQSFSSGYDFGSANWLIERGALKLAVFGASSRPDIDLEKVFPPLPFDTSIFNFASHFVLTDLNQEKQRVLPSHLIEKVVARTGKALLDKTNVIFPAYMLNTTFALIKAICEFLKDSRHGFYLNKPGYSEKNSNLLPVNFFVVAPEASANFKYSSMLGSWMNPFYQHKVYKGKNPLAHADLIAEKELLIFSSVHCQAFYESYNPEIPTIFFATHPSLCVSSIISLLNLPSPSSNRTLLMLIEPLSFETKANLERTEFQHLPRFDLETHIIDTRIADVDFKELANRTTLSILPSPNSKVFGEEARPSQYHISIDIADKSDPDANIKANVSKELASMVYMVPAGRLQIGHVEGLLDVSDKHNLLNKTKYPATNGTSVTNANISLPDMEAYFNNNNIPALLSYRKEYTVNHNFKGLLPPGYTLQLPGSKVDIFDINNRIVVCGGDFQLQKEIHHHLTNAGLYKTGTSDLNSILLENSDNASGSKRLNDPISYKQVVPQWLIDLEIEAKKNALSSESQTAYADHKNPAHSSSYFNYPRAGASQLPTPSSFINNVMHNPSNSGYNSGGSAATAWKSNPAQKAAQKARYAVSERSNNAQPSNSNNIPLNNRGQPHYNLNRSNRDSVDTQTFNERAPNSNQPSSLWHTSNAGEGSQATNSNPFRHDFSPRRKEETHPKNGITYAHSKSPTNIDRYLPDNSNSSNPGRTTFRESNPASSGTNYAANRPRPRSGSSPNPNRDQSYQTEDARPTRNLNPTTRAKRGGHLTGSNSPHTNNDHRSTNSRPKRNNNRPRSRSPRRN